MTPEQLMRSQSVDVARTAQARELAEQKHRSQIYSLATTIMVKNSELFINIRNIDSTRAGWVESDELVKRSIELAEEMFRQIEAKEKEHAERRERELSGTKSTLQLP